MAKIIDYKVAQFQYMGSFLDGVNKLIEEGWQPQGGISVTSNWYYQAMVKYEPTDEERLRANVEKAAQSRHSAKPGNHLEGV